MNESSTILLEVCIDKLSGLVDLCKEKIDFCDTHFKALSKQFKRGGSLNIIVCGPAQSGKSTLLNYLLSSDQKDREDESSQILLTGKDIEIFTPWIIEDALDLPLGKIQVEHVDYKGDVGGSRMFDTIPEFHEHLKQTYSRSVLEETMKREQRYPYRYLRINVQRQDTRVNQRLFSSAVNLIDTQGFEEVGFDTIIKALKPPFVLVCCFDASSDFHRSEICTFFKTFVECFPEADLVFVCTNVEAKLLSMHIESETVIADINYPTLLKKLQEIFTPLTEKISKKSHEVLFFDPSSKYEPLRSGASQLRERLIALRKELKVDFCFHQEMKELLLKEVVDIRNELCSLSAKQLHSDASSAIERRRKSAQGRLNGLREKLVVTLRARLESSLQQELVKLAQNRREDFMKESLTAKRLRKKTQRWLQESGLKEAVSTLLNKEISEFFEAHKDEVQDLVDPKFLKWSFIHHKISPLKLLFAFGNIVFHLIKIFQIDNTRNELDLDEGYDLVSAVRIGDIMGSMFKHGKFERDCIQIIRETTRDLLDEKQFDDICKETANACISKLEIGIKASPNICKELLHDLKRTYGIDYEKLDEVEFLLVKNK